MDSGRAMEMDLCNMLWAQWCQSNRSQLGPPVALRASWRARSSRVRWLAETLVKPAAAKRAQSGYFYRLPLAGSGRYLAEWPHHLGGVN